MQQHYFKRTNIEIGWLGFFGIVRAQILFQVCGCDLPGPMWLVWIEVAITTRSPYSNPCCLCHAMCACTNVQPNSWLPSMRAYVCVCVCACVGMAQGIVSKPGVCISNAAGTNAKPIATSVLAALYDTSKHISTSMPNYVQNASPNTSLPRCFCTCSRVLNLSRCVSRHVSRHVVRHDQKSAAEGELAAGGGIHAHTLAICACSLDDS